MIATRLWGIGYLRLLPLPKGIIISSIIGFYPKENDSLVDFGIV